MPPTLKSENLDDHNHPHEHNEFHIVEDNGQSSNFQIHWVGWVNELYHSIKYAIWGIPYPQGGAQFKESRLCIFAMYRMDYLDSGRLTKGTSSIENLKIDHQDPLSKNNNNLPN